MRIPKALDDRGNAGAFSNNTLTKLTSSRPSDSVDNGRFGQDRGIDGLTPAHPRPDDFAIPDVRASGRPRVNRQAAAGAARSAAPVSSPPAAGRASGVSARLTRARPAAVGQSPSRSAFPEMRSAFPVGRRSWTAPPKADQRAETHGRATAGETGHDGLSNRCRLRTSISTPEPRLDPPQAEIDALAANIRELGLIQRVARRPPRSGTRRGAGR